VIPLLKSAALLLRETVKEWVEDGASNIAAALAYYAIFSLSPLLIIIALFMGLVLNQQAIESGLIEGVETTIGQQAAQLIRSMLDADVNTGDILGTITWFAIVIWGASGMFAQLQTALNKIWEVKPKPGRSPLILLKNRLLSFGVVVLAALCLLGTMVVNTSLNAAIQDRVRAQNASASLSDAVRSRVANVTTLDTAAILATRAVQAVVSVAIIAILIAAVYHMLPDVDIAWRDLIVGSVFTAILLFIGQILVGLYLSRASFGTVFGAAGSLTLILVWVYYSAQILLFGAEFTEVWARRYGSHIVPDDDATWENEYKARFEVSKAGQDWSEVEEALNK
jgi:membrane protein